MSNDEEIKRVNEYKVGTMVSAIEELERMKERYSYVDEFSKAVDGLISLLLDRIARIEEEIRGLHV